MSIRFRFTPPLPLKRTSWWKKFWERQVSEKSCLSNCERGHSPKLHQAIGLSSSFQFSEVKFVGPNLLDAHAMTRRSRKIGCVRFHVFFSGRGNLSRNFHVMDFFSRFPKSSKNALWILKKTWAMANVTENRVNWRGPRPENYRVAIFFFCADVRANNVTFLPPSYPDNAIAFDTWDTGTPPRKLGPFPVSRFADYFFPLKIWFLIFHFLSFAKNVDKGGPEIRMIVHFYGHLWINELLRGAFRPSDIPHNKK